MSMTLTWGKKTTSRLPQIFKKLRYFFNPISISINSANFSNGYFIFPHNLNSIPSSNLSIFWASYKLTSQFCFRFYSTKPCTNFAAVNRVSIGDVIDLIRGDGSDMEPKLDLLGSKLTRKFVVEILTCLNLLRVPALRFFGWFQNAHPTDSRNSHLCSLVVANCGFLGDYDAMLNVLIDLRNRQICLNQRAFMFLPIPSSNVGMTKELIDHVIGLLNLVGGSCRNSGIFSLVEMLCSYDSFDLAKYVIDNAERKLSHYRVLVKHLCVSGLFEDARNLFEEMRRAKCDPDSKTYNYLISSLCKLGSIDEASAVLQDMLGRDCSPDLTTFEILIYFACRYGRSDQATTFYKQMQTCGVKPRLSTHYTFIRGYFRSQRFDEAYRYVISAAVDKCIAQDVYNFLAGLHVREGDVLVAYDILVEMLEKGLKPEYSIFQRIIRCLCENRKEDVAKDLMARYYSQDKP